LIGELVRNNIAFIGASYNSTASLKRWPSAEFARRFEQHILPKRFVKIWHGGYLAHNGKNKRIVAIHQQLNLPKPMPKVIIPFSLQMLQCNGVDYSLLKM